jgi:DNA-binding transcriptional regulator WhiA
LCHVSHVLHGFGKLKLGFFKHELSLINHELTINGWRGLLFLRVIALRIENPYNSLRQIANLPQRRFQFAKNGVEN